MGLSYVTEIPDIMGLSYVLTLMGLSYVQRPITFNDGSFSCRVTPFLLWGCLMCNHLNELQEYPHCMLHPLHIRKTHNNNVMV